MLKTIKSFLALISLTLFLVACSNEDPETSLNETGVTDTESSEHSGEESSEEEIRQIDYDSYPYFVDLSQEDSLTFSVYEGMNQLIIKAEDPWTGQISHHQQPDEKTIDYSYRIEEVPTENLLFNYTGFSGSGMTDSNTKLIIDKDGEDLEAFVSLVDTADGAKSYALVFPEELVFDTSQDLPSAATAEASNTAAESSQTAKFIEDPYRSKIDEWRYGLQDESFAGTEDIDSMMLSRLIGLDIPVSYAFLDINADGHDELLIAGGSSIIQIYNFDGEQMTHYFEDYTLGDRSQLSLYDNQQFSIKSSGGSAYNYDTLYQLQTNSSQPYEEIGKISNEEGVLTEDHFSQAELDQLQANHQIDFYDIEWRSLHSPYDPLHQSLEGISIEDVYGAYASDSEGGSSYHLDSSTFTGHLVGNMPVRNPIKEAHFTGNALFLDLDTDSYNDNSRYFSFGRDSDGTRYLLDSEGNRYTETSDTSFLDIASNDADFSDEDLALMAYLKVRDYTNHDLATEIIIGDMDPFGNGNLTISGQTVGSTRVFEVDRENNRVYHWGFLDWSNAGPHTSRAEVLNSGAINRERPTDPEADYYVTYDLLSEFANPYSLDSFQEDKANVIWEDNSDYYDSLPQ